MSNTKYKSLKTNGDLYGTGLVNINADDCSIEHIDKDFFEQSFSTLKTVSFNQNLLREFPNVFGWVKLKSIKLNNNFLTKIPSHISQMEWLTNLELANNHITEFNLSILTVESVDLSGNLIKELPDRYENLMNKTL